MQAAEAPSQSKWRFLREALAGTEQDFTQGSLSRGIALLAIPTILEMSMESLFGVVDAFWVASLGPDAMSAVGLTEALIVLVFAIAMGLATAASATVARRIGEKDPEGASLAAVQGIAGGIVVTVVLGIVGALAAPQLLVWMHAEPGTIRIGTSYTRIVLGGNFAIVMIFLINGIFRGAGDAAIAMRTLWMANLINLALDPCFIFGLGPFPRLGVTGAAVATTTGRTVGVLYQLWVLFGGASRITVARRHLRIDGPVLRQLLKVARTAMVQYFIATASWLTLARFNAAFGAAAVAGYSLAIRIILFALMPSWGICSAAATLVGQNLGARRPDRSERAVWLAGLYNMTFLTAVGIVFFTAARPLVGLFRPEASVIPIAVTCLQYVSLGYPFYAWGMIMEQAFNGAGDTTTPTWINLFCYWMLQLPTAWYLANRAGLGPRGVYLGICGAESVLAVVAIFLFRRGRWKKVVL
ncbi:MAG TPA: MATE family efflux transporter [Candidatus Acidoferrales bacterium]|nr:MATE family efflux transporter [Candidatus Acidoferrales bacterium]